MGRRPGPKAIAAAVEPIAPAPAKLLNPFFQWNL